MFGHRPENGIFLTDYFDSGDNSDLETTLIWEKSRADHVNDNRRTSTTQRPIKETIQLEGATVRLAGDSGDGMQLLGTQLTNTSALAGQ